MCFNDDQTSSCHKGQLTCHPRTRLWARARTRGSTFWRGFSWSMQMHVFCFRLEASCLQLSFCVSSCFVKLLCLLLELFSHSSRVLTCNSSFFTCSGLTSVCFWAPTHTVCKKTHMEAKKVPTARKRTFPQLLPPPNPRFPYQGFLSGRKQKRHIWKIAMSGCTLKGGVLSKRRSQNPFWNPSQNTILL